MAKQCFCFEFEFGIGTAFGAIMLAVATGTTISCSLARQYKVIGLFFFDVYGWTAPKQIDGFELISLPLA